MINETALYRYNITLENAEKFYKLNSKKNYPFEPVGAVQGWSPESMANAAKKLEKMGYKYLAIGGLVPLKVPAIHEVLKFIRKSIKKSTSIHLLGFAKADSIHEFTNYGISSFDSTSPLIRAFKDNKSNYYLPKTDGGINYYAAIRIPQAIENSRLTQGMKKGIFNPELLIKKEKIALDAVRGLDKGTVSVNSALNSVMDYHQFLIRGNGKDIVAQEKELSATEKLVSRTMNDMPWKNCQCDVCRTVGVEVIIFRSSNRNKRRGFHNLHVYHEHLKKTIG
jgi:queuine/archaeosine tRNA-ribosyltransferase